MIHYIIGPLVGAVIGYCTNFIAIKMLFYPRKAWHIGKMRVPFTPGVIPKNQSRLAEAVGSVVQKELVTKEALLDQLKESGIKEQMTATITKNMYASESTVGDWFSFIEKQGPSVDRVCEMLSEAMNDGICNTDFVPVFEQIGEGVIGGLRANPMVGLFLNDAVISSLYGKLNTELHSYMEERGPVLLEPLIRQKMDALLETEISDAASRLGISQSVIAKILDDLFGTYMDTVLPTVFEKIDVQKMVSAKIKAMEVEELERLVMSVMKHELQTVINLGALIGAIIGIVNIFV
ncbi:Protein of unknown function [Lachnospiraceae bacterium XBB1006]|nr:Protein of unknown function [Lachnospiraceae bacterium XBB1006]